MKRIYQKPEMMVVLMQHQTQLLTGTNTRTTPPEEIPDYDDWMGSREDRRGNSHGVWDEEEEEE